MIGAAVAVCSVGLGYVLGSFMGGLGRKGSLLSVFLHKGVMLVLKRLAGAFIGIFRRLKTISA